jgi:Putative DNA-binding domain
MMSVAGVARRARGERLPIAQHGPETFAASADGALARFQDGFAAALLDRDASGTHDAAIGRLLAQPGFALYRNTVLKGCIDALAANFPAVARLVGDEWFRAAAALYARANLPQRPTLLDYGAGFPTFLAGFAPAAELPYLADVARLDRCWSEAHIAADETPLLAAAVATLRPEQLQHAVLVSHASARWAWFATMPIRTIWSRNRGEGALENLAEFDWCAEGVLIARPHGVVETTVLDEAGCAFLDFCAAGGTVAEAAQASLAVDGNADLQRLMATLLAAGAFARLQLNEYETEQERAGTRSPLP